MNITATVKNVNEKTGVGKVYIYIDLYSKSSRNRIFYATVHKVEAKLFSDGKVHGRTEVTKLLNGHIQSEIETIKGLVNQLTLEGKEITKTALIEAREVKKEGVKDLVTLAKEYVEMRVDAKPKMIEKLNNLIVRLEDFQEGLTPRGKLLYPSDIDQKFINLFTQYLQKERPKHENKQLRKSQNPATINKTFSFLRQILNHYLNEGIVKDSFKNLKYPKSFTQRQMVFVENEIKQLIKYQPTSKRLEKVKDLALLQLYTGLRYSDAIKINESNIFNENLNITAEKTGQRIEIPLHPALKSLLNKYKNDFKALKISNVKYNDYLKELVKLAGIDTKSEFITFVDGKKKVTSEYKYDLVSSHTFRRSFITNAILQGIPLHVIQSITGHTTLKQLSEYVNIADQVKKAEVNKLNALFSNE